MSYEFSVFRPEHLPEILTLQHTLWRGDNSADLAYFEWKYRDNPFLPDPKMYVVLSGDEVVGVRGFHGTAWLADSSGHSVVTPTGGDTVVAPEHRSRGLFERLNRFAVTELAADGFGLVCNFSAAPVTYLRSLRSGWRAPGRFAPLGRDRQAGDGHTKPEGGVDVKTSPLGREMAALVSELDDGHGIRLRRDEVFVDWRYRNPLSSYHFLYAGGPHLGDGALDGYMVLQMRRFKRQRGMRIVDWEARDAAVFSTLLDAAVREVDTERLTIWSATVPEPFREQLLRAGFAPVDDTRGSRHYKPGPLISAIGAHATEDPWMLGDHAALDLDAWRLRMICSDSC